MSDPIRSISQNNFILADQKEVSHDNTLSGNGTPESPLGVNETVLWEGSPSTDNITLSEAATNFKFIRVFGKWHYNQSEDYGRGLEVTDEQLVPTSAISFTLSGFGIGSLTATNAVFMTTVDYRIDGSTLIRRAGIRMNHAGGNLSNTDTIEAYKVVGINRIANS